MIQLTPAERRVALLLVLLLAVGAASDLWQGRIPPRAGTTTSEPAVDGAPDPRSPPAPGADRGVPAMGEPLDLNLASARDLDALPGVGPVIAGRILEERRRLGGFRSTEDLRAVRGIGPRLFARLEPLVRVRPAPGRRAPSGTGLDSASVPAPPGGAPRVP